MKEQTWTDEGPETTTQLSGERLELETLGKEMLQAALGVLGHQSKKASAYAKLEMRKLAETLVSIQDAVARKEMTEEEARILIDMQKNAARSVLTTLEGLSVLAAERAINAALKVGQGALERVLGGRLS